ncbi:MAG: NUDIX domain-containing protein [Caldimonas sp.]
MHLVDASASHVVGSVATAIATRLVAAGFMGRGGDGALRIAAPFDDSLAAIARWLHAERLAAPWRDELLAVVDAGGRPVAAVERAVARVLGITTFAVHLVGRSPENETWVQQRAFDKATDPGLWDTLMGGQVGAGETIAVTLERETNEEAGLAIADLQGLERGRDVALRRPVAEGYMVEHIAVYRALVPAGLVPDNRDGEVERFECLREDALLERLRAGAFTLEATLILGAELERR